MANFCIPKVMVDKLKQSAIKGKLDIQKLYEMTSSERRTFFEKYTDKDLGKLLNTEFEKAMASKKRTSLTDFAKSVFSPKEQKKAVFKNVLDKIKSLEDDELLTPTDKGLLEDLIADKLGVSVTPEEVAQIKIKSEKIQKAQEAVGDDLGNPAKGKENIEFWKAKKEMDDYLQSLTPAPLSRLATGSFGRAMMLLSAKSPVLNIGSNIEVGLSEALARRLTSGALKGADNKLVVDYVKMANDIYHKTGYDISRMLDMSDTGASGERVLGEDIVHAKGPGVFRKFTKVVAEDIVFKNLMGAPDVAFSSAHFADSVNLNAMRMADGNKTKAKEFMTDAMRVEPKTTEGEILKQQGVADAMTATWTDKTWASKLTLSIRKLFNDLTGDVRLGDLLFPFIKTPANVVATGMDYAGMGIPKAAVKIVNAVRSGNIKDKAAMQSISRDLVRSGIGITGALMVTSNLKDEDFVGSYDSNRYQIEQLRNSNYNAVRFGDKWVSTDWLGPLAVPVTAIMYARKYGEKGWSERVFQYVANTASQLKNLPVVSDAYKFATKEAYKKNQSLEEMTGGAEEYWSDYVYSRTIPSFLTDIAKATDIKERQTEKGFWSGLQARTPGLRQTLPEKKNIFGETVMSESAMVDLFFGSRVKTDKEEGIIRELNRVSVSTDKGINFTDWKKSSSKQLSQFKDTIGAEKFDEATQEYGKRLKNNIEKEMSKTSYIKMTDDEKLKFINGLDTDTMNEVFNLYKFKYKRDTK